MTTTSSDIDMITRITSADEVEHLGNAAYAALIQDLHSLAPHQWETPTVCQPWTVTDMVRHLLGAAKANASTWEMARQQIHGVLHRSNFGGNALDATNAMQVADHKALGPEDLLAELTSVYPRSVRTRARKSRVYDRINLPIDSGGSTADGMPNRLNMGDLFRVVYTRDVWLHRVDIARALGREPGMDSAVDGRLVADVVKEWSDRHGLPFDLLLTGPAGGCFRRLGSGPRIELDAVEFCWILSGRGMPAPDTPGSELLGHRVLF